MKPRILFVGDSISGSTAEAFVGYAHHIEREEPGWEVVRLGVSTSAHLLSLLEQRAEAFRGFDVVYVNSGLHSLRSDRLEDLETYERNLSAAMDLLARLEGVRVIWRTTNPIAPRASGGRDGRQVPVYNEVSIRLARERGLQVDDLYAVLLPHMAEDGARGGAFLAPDGTHWTTEAQRSVIAPHIRAVVRQALEEIRRQRAPTGEPGG